MSERQVNERRNWKAQVFKFDYYIPDVSKECMYCLTEKQAETLRGIVEPLGWKTRWWSDTQEIVQDDIEEFRNDIVRRLMMSCCGSEGLIYTYNSDGELLVSDDDGLTYNPAPNDDIRNNPHVVFPEQPNEEGVDEICLAADGMVNLIREGIGDNLTEDMSRYTLGELIRNWVETMIGTSNPFAALVIIITNQIFALVVGAVIAALTDEVYLTMRCILSSNMLSDKSFDADKWEAVRSDILGQITGIAGIFLEHIVYLLGSGGLTNLARSLAGTDDTACCPSCVTEWSWPVASFGANLTVDPDTVNNWITAEAIFIGSDYYWGFQSETCCDMQVTITSGSVDHFKGLIPCPDLPTYSFYDESNPPWQTAPLTLSGNAFAVLARSSVPFTARIEFI